MQLEIDFENYLGGKWWLDGVLFTGAGHWGDMETYASKIAHESYDGEFYQAVIALHSDEFHKAQQVV